ncbi:hypothetical protein ACFYXX_32705 [Streptomyces sp. NPDC002458]|uniref:hypothetical protein n=1 Tax=Streptomyces sp. NPDC002458 TaxID=3364644 RepID=UPI00369FE6AA
MRHVPFFRWVLTIGMILIGCSIGVHLTVPDFPELRQVELMVLDEAPDGRCTVRWTDPFEHREHEAAYRCDPARDPLLKAPHDGTGSGRGWETGYVISEGADKGALYSLDGDGYGDDGTADERAELSDTLAMTGILLTAAGLLGGNLRALARVGGVRPDTVRRATRLSRAAALAAQDHARAVEAVREAWAPLRRERVEEVLRGVPVARLRRRLGGRLRSRDLEKALEKAGVRTVQEVLDSGAWKLAQLPGVGRESAEKAVAAAQGLAGTADGAVAVRLDAERPRAGTTALVSAVHVLVEAGPEARRAAEAGQALSARLEPLLHDAVAASGYRRMLGAGPDRRRRARAAVAELRVLLDWAEHGGLEQRFGQVSVDLLRGADGDAEGLDAWVGFEARPAEYYRVLTEITGGAHEGAAGSGASSPPGGARRPVALLRRSPAV